MKPGYKQTEIGEIPEDWRAETFANCFKILPNNTLSRAELNDNGGMVKNVHYGDILIKYGSILKCSTTHIPFINSPTKQIITNLLNDGDIIIADTAEDETVGKAVEISEIGKQKIASGLHTIPCRTIIPELFARGWLGYYINSLPYHNQLLPLITGTKVSAISKSSIAETIVLIPPFPEQERIAEVLSDVDEFIASLEKLIAKKRAIKQGTMQQLLTGKMRLSGFDAEWHRIEIRKLGRIVGGGTPSTKNSDWWNGNIPWISSSDLTDNNIKNINISRFITDEAVNSSATCICPKGTILIVSRVGLGKVAIAPCELCTSQDFTNIITNDISPVFIAHMISHEMQKMSMKSQGTSIKGITVSDISAIELFIPDKNEQEAIANTLEDIDKEIESLSQKLSKTRQFKQGMMQQLLTGKIRLV